jgi:ribosomal protein S27AE
MDEVKALPLTHGKVTPVEGECPQCENETLLTTTWYVMTPNGVTPRIKATICAACSLISQHE